MPGNSVMRDMLEDLKSLQILKGLPNSPPPDVIGQKRREAMAYEAARRLAAIRCESLRLYEPLPEIDKFHRCHAPDRILRGSNRGGKTLAAAVEMARAATGQDPHGKYPLTDGRAFIVGKDGKHNSEVLYRKLCRSNPFRVIWDETSGGWRSWRPWLESDMRRKSETKPAKPLIPKRFIREISWESAKDMQPTLIRLTTGWEIRFFSSLGSPPQGSDIDLAWFDEEIVNQEWYPEISARLIDRSGKFWWSATAQLGGPQLYDLCLMADEMRGTKRPRVVEFFAHINDNRYFTEQQRQLFYEKLTDDQRRIRIEGEFAFTAYRVYPEYESRKYCVEPFTIPPDWCRYMVVDPGRQICAVLFAAVPPPGDEKYAGKIVFYDELYIRNCNADIFGKEVRDRVIGQNFQAFIIDYRGGRVRMMDSGVTIEQQYSEALKKYGIESTDTGHSFTWANDDVEAGVMAFRSWLNPTKDAPPKLLVFGDRLPHFEYEIQRYHYKRVKEGYTDVPEKTHNHLMDCCRYLAMYDPRYKRPKPRRSKYNPAEIVKNKLRMARKKKGPGFISLG